VVRWDRQVIADMKKQREEEQLLKRHLRDHVKQGKGFDTAQGSLTMVDQTQRYVLVAEDNQMISFLLQETLKTMSYVAVIADNGRIAVEKFTSFLKDGMLFEMILMDILMPEMGGYEATKLIR